MDDKRSHKSAVMDEELRRQLHEMGRKIGRSPASFIRYVLHLVESRQEHAFSLPPDDGRKLRAVIDGPFAVLFTVEGDLLHVCGFGEVRTGPIPIAKGAVH